MSKILIISEGTKPDKKIIEYLFEKYKKFDIKYEIETYNTNIYVLYEDLKREYGDDLDSIDIIPILKSKNPEFKYEKNDFSEIYLFFDYEGHHPGGSPLKMIEMLKYFNNETEKGKLYVNYPMVESFFHIDFKNLEIYKNLNTEIELGSGYKNLKEIKKYNGQFIQNQEKFDLEKLNLIFKQNIMKENFIVNDVYSKVEYESYREISNLIIFSNQKSKFIKYDKISVLSTFPKFIIEYFGEKLYNTIF